MVDTVAAKQTQITTTVLDSYYEALVVIWCSWFLPKQIIMAKGLHFDFNI